MPQSIVSSAECKDITKLNDTAYTEDLAATDNPHLVKAVHDEITNR